MVIQRVTQKYLFPFKEDLCRFDFEVDSEDEYMCSLNVMAKMAGLSNGESIE